MNWKTYWNTVASNQKQATAQVQRNSLQDVENTAQHIIKTLQITKNDTVLDVCCGNGLLTQYIANHCKNIVGVDQSQVLLDTAELSFTSENAVYQLADATTIASTINQQFDKIYLQFSFQYFDKKGQGKQVISQLKQLLKTNGKLFIGDIPNHDKKFVFYNTLKKRFFLLTSKLKGTNPMGKFWKKSELNSICQDLGLKGQVIVQSNKLPYAWYRFDYLINH